MLLGKRLHAAGGSLRLANVNEDLGAILRLTRLDTVFDIDALPTSTRPE